MYHIYIGQTAPEGALKAYAFECCDNIMFLQR